MRYFKKAWVAIGGVALLMGVILLGVKLSPAPKNKLEVGGESFEVEIADTPARRGQGLSGREGLGEKEGMLFLFDSPTRSGFWMRDMKFALDFVWIFGDTVVGITPHVLPEPEKTLFTLPVYYPPQEITQMLEVPAGTAEKFGISIGDKVRLDKAGWGI